MRHNTQGILLCHCSECWVCKWYQQPDFYPEHLWGGSRASTGLLREHCPRYDLPFHTFWTMSYSSIIELKEKSNNFMFGVRGFKKKHAFRSYLRHRWFEVSELYSRKLSVTSQQKAKYLKRTTVFGDVPSLKEQEDPCRIQLFLFPNKVSTHPIVVIISVFLRKLLPSMFSPHDSEGVKPFPFPSFRVGHVTQAWVNWLWSNSLIRVWLKNSHGLQDSVLRFLLELVGKRSLGLGSVREC